MYIRRKVFSMLEVYGEEKLFSTTEFVLEQKEYSNAKQKALRRVWDLKKGLESSNNTQVYPFTKENFIRLGRSEARSTIKEKGVHGSINAKGNHPMNSSGAVFMRSPKNIAQFKGEKSVGGVKLNRKLQVKNPEVQKRYDHNFDFLSPKEQIGSRKSTMKNYRK